MKTCTNSKKNITGFTRRNANKIGPARHSEREDGFTLVELLVVIAIIALLMAILLPALGRARELGKRAVCLSQEKQLGTAWYMYCDDNKEKLPVGDVWFSWDPGFTGGEQLAWIEYPHTWPHSMPPTRATNHDLTITNPTRADWQHAIVEGTMWRWVKDYKVYKCPVGDKGQEATYYMSQSMNCYPPGSGDPTPVMQLRSQIKRTSDQFVFLDVGSVKEGAFFESYTICEWGNLPPTRHGVGTTFIFADQHATYRKWTDPHALKAIELGGWLNPAAKPGSECDCDLRWILHGTWGKINPASSFQCTTPGKKCEY